MSRSTRGGEQNTSTSLGVSQDKDKRIRPDPIKRSKDEVMLLQMQNIFNKKSLLFKTDENACGSGADLAASLPSGGGCRPGARTAMQVIYGTVGSRNNVQPMI